MRCWVPILRWGVEIKPWHCLRDSLPNILPSFLPSKPSPATTPCAAIPVSRICSDVLGWLSNRYLAQNHVHYEELDERGRQANWVESVGQLDYCSRNHRERRYLLLPLNCAGRLGRHVVDDAVDAPDLIHNATGDGL